VIPEYPVDLSDLGYLEHPEIPEHPEILEYPVVQLYLEYLGQ
jgi:hypothetical protein